MSVTEYVRNTVVFLFIVIKRKNKIYKKISRNNKSSVLVNSFIYTTIHEDCKNQVRSLSYIYIVTSVRKLRGLTFI